MLSLGVQVSESLVFRVQKTESSFYWTTCKLVSVSLSSCVVSVGGDTIRIARNTSAEITWKDIPINIYYLEPKGRKAQLGFEAPRCVGIQRDSFIGSLRK